MIKINTKKVRLLALLAVLIMGAVLVSGCGHHGTPKPGSVDITGAWHGTYDSSKGSGEWSWLIKKSGNEYTGVLTTTGPYSGGNVPVSVTLKGNKITVGWVAAGVVFEGTVSKDKMSGTWKFQDGMDHGSWEGVRGESSITPKEASNSGQLPQNQPEESVKATGLPVYPDSQETSEYNTIATMIGFSGQYAEVHQYAVSGASPTAVIKWYKSKFPGYTVENEGSASVQGVNYALLTLKKENTMVGVAALKQGGETVYFVGKATAPEEEGEALPNHDMASGEEPIGRYPGSIMLSYSKEGKFPTDYEIEYGTNDAYDKVGDWYKSTLQSQGWNVTSQSGSADTVELKFAKDDDEVTIYVGAPSAGTAYTEITLAYTKRSLPDHDLVNGKDPLPRYVESVMEDYHKSAMTAQGINSTEIKVVYLTSDTFDKVKQWYLDKLNQMFSAVSDNGESIDAGSQSGNKTVEVHIDFEAHKTYTEVSVDYTTVNAGQ